MPKMETRFDEVWLHVSRATRFCTQPRGERNRSVIASMSSHGSEV